LDAGTPDKESQEQEELVIELRIENQAYVRVIAVIEAEVRFVFVWGSRGELAFPDGFHSLI